MGRAASGRRSAAGDREDREAVARWLGEGGRDVRPRVRRSRVVIVGAGVAGLEAVLALDAYAPGRLDTTIVAPERTFVNRSMAATQAFGPARWRGVDVRKIVEAAGARWHRGAVDRIVQERRCVVTRDGATLPYDYLVLALGARSRFEWDDRRVLTFHGGQDSSRLRLLVRQLQAGAVRTVAFVRRPGCSWPLPLYDLAMLNAAACRQAGALDARLVVVTPEDEPLGAFGARAAGAVRKLLADRGIGLVTGSSATPGGGGMLDLAPGDRCLRMDRIVTLPVLVGPHLSGLACGADGFIPVDAFGRVPGCDRVFAAGDATTFPVKQGGLAAQQAIAVAQAIAADAGAAVEPQPFRPVLRAALLTGSDVRYLRSDISGGAGDDSEVSRQPLWWPPNRLCARFLGPHLARQSGEALDVLPYRGATRRFGIAVPRGCAELTDLPRSPLVRP